MAKTIAQLKSILGSTDNNATYRYFDPAGDFTAAMRQVLPRLWDMGLWKDVTYEQSFPNTIGYVTLPPDTDAVLACTVNGYPRPVRSLWHDIRITGRSTYVNYYYGAVDDGFHPVTLDFSDVQGLPPGTTALSEGLMATNVGGTATIAFTDLTGTVTITGISDAGYPEVLNAVDSAGNLQFSGTVLSKILSIVFQDPTAELFELRDIDFPDEVIATVPTGAGVLRFRRFRVSSPSDNAFVHFLMKRSCPADLTDDTIIYLDNLGAIKSGLLALMAEDNSDLDRADRHWKAAERCLDRELESILGAAKPSLNFDLSGTGQRGVGNLY